MDYKMRYELDLIKLDNLDQRISENYGATDPAPYDLQTEQDIMTAVKFYGGHLYRVGGSVRDSIVGLEPNDVDYLVTFPFGGMVSARNAFKEAHYGRMGNEYPVFRFKPFGGPKHEISFSNAFIKDDLSRRDITINAMAIEVTSGNLIDPFGGQKDLHDGIIRHVNSTTFNPLAAFRAARFVCSMQARLGKEFTIAPETLEVMNQCHPEKAPAHRIRFEIETVRRLGMEDLFFESLEQAGIWVYYREIDEDHWGNTTEPVVFVE